MPTVNPRINMTLETGTAALLAEMALVEEKSVSRLAKELLMEGLELREDKLLSAIAEARDIPKAKKVTHSNAWK